MTPKMLNSLRVISSDNSVYPIEDLFNQLREASPDEYLPIAYEQAGSIWFPSERLKGINLLLQGFACVTPEKALSMRTDPEDEDYDPSIVFVDEDQKVLTPSPEYLPYTDYGVLEYRDRFGEVEESRRFEDHVDPFRPFYYSIKDPKNSAKSHVKPLPKEYQLPTW